MCYHGSRMTRGGDRMIVTTADEIRAIEEMENRVGTDFLTLMERAGTGCAERIMAWYPKETGPVAVLCGSGKNGGDGYVIARTLHKKGYDVAAVAAFGDPKAADAVENRRRADDLGVPTLPWGTEAKQRVQEAAVLVDCLFGIGFRGAANEAQAEVFEAMNASPAAVVSIDVPSGVVTDTGEVLGSAVRADQTLAISTLKPLHTLYPAREYCGEIAMLDIGLLPESLGCVTPTLRALDDREAAALLPRRVRTAHKNDAGHMLSVCGSYRMPGAACLCAAAALRAGAGLVTAACPASAYPTISAHLTESMYLPLPESSDGTLSAEALPALREALTRATVLVAGPGLGQSEELTELLAGLLSELTIPAVLDADALNALAKRPEALRDCAAPLVLTPHPGEMARLTGTPVATIEADRRAAARALADDLGLTVLLKGADTIVATAGSDTVFVNTTGNEGLAKGGSGDTLSGILAAFLAQGMAPAEAAAAAAFYHGKAAEHCARTMALRSICASDLIAALPAVLP